MEVQLYVYDLTRGMARELSMQFLGIHIDAVYHTSLIYNKVEYFFGAGVQTSYPGSTHHGRPMEVVSLGFTQLPPEIIFEYLESLKEVYTPESYDLFTHNCNNFTNDFAMFLVGRGIPEHITNLPQRVMETPFGQMLKPQLDASMRSVTQAPVPPQAIPGPSSTANGTAAARSTRQPPTTTIPASSAKQTRFQTPSYGSVIYVTATATVQKYIGLSRNSGLVIFFTSSMDKQCKPVSQKVDDLAKQYPQIPFIKLDVSKAPGMREHYKINIVPTFVTVNNEQPVDRWMGVDTEHLKANVKKLIDQLSPPHPHRAVKVPTLQLGSLTPVTYVKVPPLDKLMARIPSSASDKELAALRSFVEARTANAKDATLPDLPAIARAFRTDVLTLLLPVRFAAVDLLRCAMVDARVSGFFAEEGRTPGTISSLIKHVSELDNCPHNLRLVTIHLACNFFASTLAKKEIMRAGNTLAPVLVQLVISSLLDNVHPTTRVAAASLAFNLATANYIVRDDEEREGIETNQQVELAAGLIEALSTEQSSDATKALLLSLGYLLHFASQNGEVREVSNVLDAKRILAACNDHEALAKEVVSLL